MECSDLFCPVNCHIVLFSLSCMLSQCHICNCLECLLIYIPLIMPHCWLRIIKAILYTIDMIYTIYHKGYSTPGDPKGTGEITGHLGETLLVKKVT